MVRQPRCDSSTVPHISDTSLTQPSIPALLEEDMVGVRVSSICLFHFPSIRHKIKEMFGIMYRSKQRNTEPLQPAKYLLEQTLYNDIYLAI